MVNPNRTTGWQVVILLMVSALLCLTVESSDQDETASPATQTAVGQ